MRKLGFIARSDLGGLGIESRAFVKHLNPDKVMVIKIGGYSHFTEDFPEAVIVEGEPTDGEMESFLKGLDVLFCIETPYNLNTFRLAREMGVKTICRINYEWYENLGADLLLNPVDWYQDKVRAKFLPFPVDIGQFRFKLRTKAERFLHIAGHNAAHDRNGTQLLLEAIPLVKSDIRFIIHAQSSIPRIDDPRIEWRVGNYRDNSDMYDADIMVLPRRYAGQALSVNEAMSCGLPVIATDMSPLNKIINKDLLIAPEGFDTIKVYQEIEIANISPSKIAEKIDSLAHKDISRYSEEARAYAESISWGRLKPKYIKIINEI